MLKVEKTGLKNVFLIKPDVFEDARGEYVELWNKIVYHKQRHIWNVLRDVDFCCDDISISYKNVLRGIHSDRKAWKLVSCLYGRIYLVVVNCDKKNKGFRKWKSFILTGSNHYQVLVPPNHGVAHLVLSKKAVFHYKQSEYYDINRQDTYRYDDKTFGIWWPDIKPMLSMRDEINGEEG